MACTFELVEGFLYPGHSVARMHGTPNRTGAELMAMLVAAADKDGLDVLTNAHVTRLFVTADDAIRGVEVTRPNGACEQIGCRAAVLACSGFGGNPDLVKQHIPAIAQALYFGHTGNQGDALRWGEALGAATADLSGYQGHGSVAHPHGVLITWALMMEGGVQVNVAGERFANEHAGYSEQAEAVLAQPGGIAFDIYDERLHQLGMEFEDYRGAVKMGAVKSGGPAEDLARQFSLPERRFAETIEGDRCGRARGRSRCLRSQVRSDETADATLLWCPRHRHAVSHSGRTGGRSRRPRASQEWSAVPESVRRRRRRARALRA